MNMVYRCISLEQLHSSLVVLFSNYPPSYLLEKLSEQYFLPILWNEYNMVLTFPPHMR